jgi:predicted nucleotidyltransferase
MRDQIEQALAEIEGTEGATILYACESGSRAWGFASLDSDYDVRFIYLRPASWYLAVDLEAKRDVIERPISDELDVSGWDLRKALQLFRKSNPPLLEWLGSPIVYREVSPLAARMRELAKSYYSPTACGYHYLNMARNNCREFLRSEQVRRKKYFYVLRPLLAIRWIEAELGVVPTEFAKLVDATVDDQTVRRAIDDLVAEKAAAVELGVGPRIPVLSDFAYAELARLETTPFGRAPPTSSVEPLNELFQGALRELAERTA